MFKIGTHVALTFVFLNLFNWNLKTILLTNYVLHQYLPEVAQRSLKSFNFNILEQHIGIALMNISDMLDWTIPICWNR